MTETLPPPRDFAALKALIAERAQALPKRLTQIASFALENPDEIAFGTVSSIAEQAQVQPSTLVRFSQALGYQGFSDMQEIFRSRLRDRILNYDERLQQLREHARETSKPNVIFHGFCEASAKSIAALQEKLDPASLDGAVEQLAAAETIYLIGLRRSFPIASYMAYALGKLGVRAILVDAVGGLAAEQITFAGPKDAVLAISFTPYASETVSLTRAAADKGVPIVSITDSPFSPLAQTAGLWIEISEANFEGFRSMAATLTLAMTLTVAIAERREQGA
ncbi:MAG: MurR/RpiR family transcriptional regulator [Alphaproteobacteria bacterium]|uniref:MurR/RpiR family transcriptional regulator n=1 Tax=Aestuariivirga sp. TaxID=2650926 RepID=UPI0030199C63|nr:MurR/RpiR family transcriptional regulator [Alphaproteobacteria bacterium]